MLILNLLFILPYDKDEISLVNGAFMSPVGNAPKEYRSMKSLYKQNQFHSYAVIAQLGERMTEDHKVAGSIPAHGISNLLSSRLNSNIRSQ